MTKQEMLLPLTCETHVHLGYGSRKDVPCPWCEIERLQGELVEAARISHLYRNDAERLGSQLPSTAVEPIEAQTCGYCGQSAEEFKASGKCPLKNDGPILCQR